ncbi:MAG TPA: choice-of-anchor D domain-containing protein [Solirubrobacteraceae bacterium]|nr:choice-of-anchor D domain-containing protein [Solirubrobacteraceae bacterium]
MAIAFAWSAALAAAGNVTTAAYNNLRDGWDPNEPALSPSALRSTGFQKLFATKLSGAIYAQPLVYEGTLVATTEKARAYGLDAVTGAIRWQRSFGTAFKSSAIGCTDLKPNLGSTSTPVIDPATGTLYVTTRLEIGRKGGHLANARWFLQALKATTGEERPGFPVEIKGTPYNTPGIQFNEAFQEQRPGLLLLEGVVYVAFASDCDINPYRGIVAGFDATTGAMTTMWSDESGPAADEGSMGGVWQSGGGLVSDLPGRIILTTGNGVSPTVAPSNAPPQTLSESVVGLTVGAGGQLAPSQFFAPHDAPTLDQDDEDLGSGGPIALPSEYFGTPGIPHLVIQDGKDGRLFLLDADDMGGYLQGPEESDAVLQQLGPFDGVWGHPAAYGGQGGWVYVLESAGGGSLAAYGSTLGPHGEPQLVPEGQSTESFGYASGSPIVTSDGTTSGSAVVWVIYAGENGKRGQLRAYGAIPEEGVLPLLWSGKIGTASKFAVPTASEGRVYVGTRSGSLEAFGASGNGPLQASPVEFGTVAVGHARTLRLSLAAARALRLTGPITTAGVEPLSAKAATSHQTVRHGLTAGPKKIPASESPLGAGVLAVKQPPRATRLADGQRLGVSVSFKPARPGPIVGLLQVRTSAGVRTIPVSGYGSAPGLIRSAPPLDFGEIATHAGGKYLTFTISNSWTRPERIAAVHLPGGAYQVSGAPAAGTVLGPHRSLTIAVHFEPAAPGTYVRRVRIASDHGGVTVTLAGRAVNGRPRLSLRPRTLDFGAVPVGASRTLRFTIFDAGNVPLTITRAIPPADPFAADKPVPEGLTIGSGSGLTEAITFTPRATGPAGGSYVLAGDDGRGHQLVRLVGRGVTKAGARRGRR